MALMRDGLRSIGNETKEAPEAASEVEKYAKFVARRESASNHFISENITTILVWSSTKTGRCFERLSNQFQKKIWASKLVLRRKLYSLKLKEGQPVQSHIKEMTTF